MKKGRKPLEFLNGERIYYVNKAKNGRGDIYGVVYLPENHIHKRVKVELVKLKKGQKIEKVQREYSLKKLSNTLRKKRVHNSQRTERRLKK